MKPLLKLTLFGAPTITLGEQPLTGALTGKLLALFLYLAVTAAKGAPPHTRDALADLFWSELPQGQRRSNLRYLLSDLRQFVGDYLVITPQTVCFNRQAPYWLDVEVVRTTFGEVVHRATPTEIATALALYQGEFLAGLRVRNAPAFMHWVTQERQELHALVVHAPQPSPNALSKHNLPGQLTPFFGREAEIVDILTHLTQDNYRLLTIIGEGGVGKTRLALAVAQVIVDCRFQIFDSSSRYTENLQSTIKNQFLDGIWFVALADLTATPDLADQLATVIAKALDLSLSGQGTPTMQVCHYLAHKRLLLILDNFEQLVAHTDFLLHLLQKCRGIRVLVTSRQQLNLQAEHPWRLMGLPLPPQPQATTLAADELRHYASVALFVERARRADPQFQLTAANQAAVVALCYWLDGLPLGIELAAALCKEYTCAALLTALQTDYALLTTTLPDLPVRHRSIRATLAHSWCLLDQEMAAMLAACAVFQGGFTVGAATAVIGALPTTIQRLVDHSLLRAHRHETTGWRYDLHELVRHYAEEQLMQTPARYRQVQVHHAAYYLAQLQQLAPHLLQDGTAQAVVQRESANIRAAWHYGVAEQWIDRLFQGVEGLATFYRLTGLHNTAYLAFQPALEMVRQAEAQAQTHPLLAALLLNLSEFCRYLDRLAEAEALAQEAFTLGRQYNNAAIQCRACYERARLAQGRAQYVLMRDLAAQAYHQARQSGVVRLCALSRHALGASHLLVGDLATAIQHYQAVLDYLQQEGDRKLEAMTLSHLGSVYLRQRAYTTAIDYLSQAMTLAHSLNDRHSAASANALLGSLWLDLGAFERSHAAYTAALQTFTEVREPYWESWVHTGQAYLWWLEGQYDASAQAALRGLALAQDKMPLFEHQALTYLAHARWAQGDVAAAEALLRRALTLQQEGCLQFRLAEPSFRLALLVLQEYNDGLAAQNLLEETLQQMVTQGYAVVAEPFGVYYAGYCVLQANDDPRAGVILQQAHRLLQDALANIADATLHHAFLTNIPWRRELWTLAQAHSAATDKGRNPK